jgi:FG-GAP-like repeat/Lectin C-type domain
MDTNSLVQASAIIQVANPLQPQLNLSSASRNFLISSLSSSGAAVIDSALTITGPATNTLPQARVSISNFNSATSTESLSTIGTLPAGITASFNSSTGVLTLNGAASVVDYQTALRQVAYSNSNPTPTTTPSNIQFTIGDLVVGSNGHYYKYVSSQIDWNTARDAAANPANQYYGLTGYLATITSSDEQNLVQTVKGNNFAWIGGSDETTEGDWRWVTGPEGEANGNVGTPFWSGTASGTPVSSGAFQNWLPGEPNATLPAEDYITMLDNGIWLDSTPNNSNGYVIEYGGLSGEATVTLSGSIAINLTNQNTPNQIPAIVGGNNIAFRNYASGQNAIWQLNDATLADSKFITPVSDKNWTMVASADFDGDGKDDLLWRNYSTGENAIWLKNGTNLDSFSAAGQKFITQVVDTDWKMIAAADFNGDGKADILWRNNRSGENAVWFIDANTVTNDGRYASNEQFFANSIRVIDTNWEMVGAGNFDTDNKADIVWRNKVTGENAIWLMDGTTGPSVVDGTVGTAVESKAGGQKFITQVADSNWKIVGIGDFNQDNKSDLVWRNSSTGENAVWTVDTSVLTNSGNFFSTTEQFIKDENGVNLVVQGNNWRIEAVGDTNNDGKSDLIWRNYATDENAVWQMNENIAATAGRQIVKFSNNTTVLTGDINWEIIDSYIA